MGNVFGDLEPKPTSGQTTRIRGDDAGDAIGARAVGCRKRRAVGCRGRVSFGRGARGCTRDERDAKRTDSDQKHESRAKVDHIAYMQ